MGRLLDEDIVIDALIGISGSKSIEELTEECEVYQSDNRCYSGGVYGAIRAIKALPTIQPEKAQLSKEGTTSDMISRAETVERLRGVLDVTVPITDYDGGYVDGVEVGISTVSTMSSALNNQVNLCDSCTYTYPECPSEKDDVIFGNGIGNDNICACNKYQTTVQPVATDTNVGDKISKFIDGLEEIFADLRERHVDDSVCGLCEYDGAYMGQSGDWCNECPGFDRDDCFKLSDKTRKEWTDEIIKALPPAQPEPQWIPVEKELPEPRIDVWVNSDLGQMVGYYDEMVNLWYGRDYLELIVNAWMPLPEAYKPNK